MDIWNIWNIQKSFRLWKGHAIVSLCLEPLSGEDDWFCPVLCNSDTAKLCPWSADYSECVPLAEPLDTKGWLGRVVSAVLLVSQAAQKCKSDTCDLDLEVAWGFQRIKMNPYKNTFIYRKWV